METKTKQNLSLTPIVFRGAVYSEVIGPASGHAASQPPPKSSCACKACMTLPTKTALQVYFIDYIIFVYHLRFSRYSLQLSVQVCGTA